MKKANRFLLCVSVSVGCVFAMAASVAQAQDWFSLANVSNTVGTNANRLCSAFGAAGDLGCASYAPSLTTAGDISITGNASANRFIGDGSLLTNISASNISGLTTDRIISTSANIVAGNGGTISFTTGGTSGTAYFGTTGQLVLPTISTTGAVSFGTTGYFGGDLQVRSQNVNISLRAFNGSNPLDVSTTLDGTTVLGVWNNSTGTSARSRLGLYNTSSTYAIINLNGVNAPTDPNALTIAAPFTGAFPIIFTTAGTEGMRLDGARRLGIQISNPSTTLHISGTLRLSNGNEACDTNRTGAIRYSGTDFQVCYGTGGWASLVDASGTTVTSDRITSGTTDVRARADGSISFTTAGTTTGYFYNGQLVANRISTTGAISATSIYAGASGQTGSMFYRDASGVLTSVPSVTVVTDAGLSVGAGASTDVSTGILVRAYGATSNRSILVGVADRDQAGGGYIQTYNGDLSFISAYRFRFTAQSGAFANPYLFSSVVLSAGSNFNHEFISAGPTWSANGAFNNNLIVLNLNPTISRTASIGNRFTMIRTNPNGGAPGTYIDDYLMDLQRSNVSRFTVNDVGSARIASWTTVNTMVTPTAPLEVSGTISSTVIQLSNNPSNACNTGAYGTIKVVNGRMFICRP